MTLTQQATLLRALADRLEEAAPLPPELEEALERELEDRLDREAIREAGNEEGSVTLEELKQRLGMA